MVGEVVTRRALRGKLASVANPFDHPLSRALGPLLNMPLKERLWAQLRHIELWNLHRPRVRLRHINGISGRQGHSWRGF